MQGLQQHSTPLALYFVSPRERPWRQPIFRRKTLVTVRTTCVFSYTFKKEHIDWRINDASWSVYSWTRSVTSRSFSGWDKVQHMDLQALFSFPTRIQVVLFLPSFFRFSRILTCWNPTGTLWQIVAKMTTNLAKNEENCIIWKLVWYSLKYYN